MKKIVALALTLALLLSLVGCGLFRSEDVLKLGDYDHRDPKGLTYDERLALKAEDFGATLGESLSAAAYPDLMLLDESGSMVGLYDYDEETGLAKGWTSMADGSYTAFEPGQEVDLGKPDESKIVTLAGDVTLYFVVYGNKDKVVEVDGYLFLTDAKDKDTVMDAMQELYGAECTAESDTVLKCVQSGDALTQELAALGYSDGCSAKTYASLLQQVYGVHTDGGEAAFRPYSGHTDPSDLTFDQRVVLTGSGTASVTEEYAADVSSMTDYLYGSEGKLVAQYTYIECPSKEAADALVEGEMFPKAERISDTVLLNKLDGKELQDTLAAYMGYSVLKDDSVEEYVRMIEETYFSVVCEQ